MVRKVRGSNPGPDGLPYSAWGATVGGIASLYRVLIALTLGARPPGWFDSALVIFIPKGVAAGEAYAATEPEYRLLTLADNAQKLVAKAVHGVLATVAATTVHEVQTGFLGVRSMLGSALRIEGAVEEFLFECASRTACRDGPGAVHGFVCHGRMERHAGRSAPARPRRDQAGVPCVWVAVGPGLRPHCEGVVLGTFSGLRVLRRFCRRHRMRC